MGKVRGNIKGKFRDTQVTSVGKLRAKLGANLGAQSQICG